MRGGADHRAVPEHQVLARTIREHTPTLTPALSLTEGEGAISIPSPPEGERVRVREPQDVANAFMNCAG